MMYTTAFKLLGNFKEEEYHHLCIFYLSTKTLLYALLFLAFQDR